MISSMAMVPSCHGQCNCNKAMSYTGGSEDTRVVLLSAGSIVSVDLSS